MRNLTIARAGDGSKHETWLSDPSRKNFDLLVAYYGDEPGKWKARADRYDHTKGLKYPWFNDFLKSNPWVLEYDAVLLADDDLEGDTATLADAFDVFHGAGLWLAQPALTEASVVSFPVLKASRGRLLRYLGFVEPQMPILSRECLRRLQGVMLEGGASGWGLSIVWSQVLGYPVDKMAVIDACPMKHMRPLQTGDMYTKVLPALGKDAGAELAATRTKYKDDMRQEVFREVLLDLADPMTLERLGRQR